MMRLLLLVLEQVLLIVLQYRADQTFSPPFYTITGVVKGTCDDDDGCWSSRKPLQQYSSLVFVCGTGKS